MRKQDASFKTSAKMFNNVTVGESDAIVEPVVAVSLTVDFYKDIPIQDELAAKAIVAEVIKDVERRAYEELEMRFGS